MCARGVYDSWFVAIREKQQKRTTHCPTSQTQNFANWSYFEHVEHSQSSPAQGRVSNQHFCQTLILWKCACQNKHSSKSTQPGLSNCLSQTNNSTKTKPEQYFAKKYRVQECTLLSTENLGRRVLQKVICVVYYYGFCIWKLRVQKRQQLFNLHRARIFSFHKS